MPDRRGPTRPPAAPQGTGRLTAATILFCVACMVLLALRRAGWLDEYWTVWHSDPALPFRTAYWTRWIQDTPHPPTFYAYAWTIGHVAGPTLAARRLIANGAALVLLATATVLACRRRGDRADQPVLFALLMISGPFAITYFAEHRSYFLGLTAAACLVATLRQLHRESVAGRPRLALRCWFVLLTILALNIHYTTSVCLLAVLGCATLFHWFSGRRATALLIAGAVACALVPLALTASIAFRLHPVPVVVQIALLRGWTTILVMLAAGALVNPVFLAIAASGLRDRRGRDENGFVLILAAALVLLVLAFAGLQAVSHNLVPRLLLGLIPPTSALMAELASRRWPDRRIVAAGCVVAAIVATATTIHELRNPRWEYSAGAIAAAVRACPATRVVAVSPLVLLPPGDPGRTMTGQWPAIALSYELIARRYGFAVHVVPGATPLPPSPRACPTLVWMEHNFFRQDLQAADLARLAGIDPSGATLSLTNDGSHFLLSVTPAKPVGRQDPSHT